MKADLEAIEARLERVPREFGLCLDMKDWGKNWEVARITNCGGTKDCNGDHVITTVNMPASVRAQYNEHDEAVFLANAPQDMRALVHEVKRSRAYILELQERAKWMGDMIAAVPEIREWIGILIENGEDVIGHADGCPEDDTCECRHIKAINRFMAAEVKP